MNKSKQKTKSLSSDLQSGTVIIELKSKLKRRRYHDPISLSVENHLAYLHDLFVGVLLYLICNVTMFMCVCVRACMRARLFFS